MDQTVTTALIRVALHINALSGGGLGWGGVFIMAIGGEGEDSDLQLV